MKERCREILLQAEVLLDGEEGRISREELVVIRQHLEDCPPCYQNHELGRRVVLRIKQLQGKDKCPDRLRVRMTTLLFEDDS